MSAPRRQAFSLDRDDGGAGQGVHPAHPRPAHLCHDPRRAGRSSCCCSAMRSTPTRATCRPPCWCRRTASSPARSSSALANSSYFDITASGAHARPSSTRLVRTGEVQFAITIPGDFTRRVVRGDRAQILVEADATDPTATGSALAALAAPAAGGAAPRPHRRRCARAAEPAPPFEVVDPPPLQSGEHHRLQHRARPARHRPDADPGDDDRDRRHPRAGARHDGEPAGDAGAAARGDDRQARALRDRRHDPDRARSWCVARLLFGVPMAGGWAGPDPRRHPVHHRLAGAGLPDLDPDPHPAPGDAAFGLLPAAVDPAVGLHVPVPRHAGMGAVARHDHPGDPFPAGGARRAAQGPGLRRHGAEPARARHLRLRGRGAGAARYRTTLD